VVHPPELLLLDRLAVRLDGVVVRQEALEGPRARAVVDRLLERDRVALRQSSSSARSLSMPTSSASSAMPYSTPAASKRLIALRRLRVCSTAQPGSRTGGPVWSMARVICARTHHRA
jgi:hypothetical protein